MSLKVPPPFLVRVLAATKADHDRLLAERKPGQLAVIYFWADWSPECKQMDAVVDLLAKENKDVVFLKVEAEVVEGVADLYPIESVPACVLLKEGVSSPVDIVVGADPPKLVGAVGKHKAMKKSSLSSTPFSSSSSSEGKEDLNTRLGKLVKAAPVMLFMKGSPANARCKFSKQMVQLLKEQETFSNWKTFPQLYIEGKLVGGLDIVKAHIEEEDFKDMLPKGSSKEGLEAKLKGLINKATIMLFMKGEPGAEKCGFSRKIVEILKETGVGYSTFDILTDQEVRQGLKKFSNWPTYPQLYVKGTLVGGLDVVTELKEDGELLETLRG
eukprot:jgi/Bigna1/74833/fgenesh1_pg.31_\